MYSTLGMLEKESVKYAAEAGKNEHKNYLKGNLIIKKIRPKQRRHKDVRRNLGRFIRKKNVIKMAFSFVYFLCDGSDIP